MNNKQEKEPSIGCLVRHNKRDKEYGIGVILDKKTVVYTSDMISEDPLICKVWWTKANRTQKHFLFELEEL